MSIGARGLFSVALSLRLFRQKAESPPGVIRHRMSMEPGLSSPATFRSLPERPSGRLTMLKVARVGAAVKPVPTSATMGLLRPEIEGLRAER